MTACTSGYGLPWESMKGGRLHVSHTCCLISAMALPGKNPPRRVSAIGERGVVAFVTNGSWIDGNVDSGVRSCLVEEFSSIHVLNLRGNQRTQGERSRQEGGKVFGQGSRAPVAITILVRNPNVDHGGCRIFYRDVGDYLSREDKLAIVREAGSIAGINDWREIVPDRHNDWISQRDEAFQALYPIGSKSAKSGRTDEAIFQLFSNGYQSGWDTSVYNFSHIDGLLYARRMVAGYNSAMREMRSQPQNTNLDDGCESRMAMSGVMQQLPGLRAG